jgi:hypothetical protein
VKPFPGAARNMWAQITVAGFKIRLVQRCTLSPVALRLGPHRHLAPSRAALRAPHPRSYVRELCVPPREVRERLRLRGSNVAARTFNGQDVLPEVI